VEPGQRAECENPALGWHGHCGPFDYEHFNLERRIWSWLAKCDIDDLKAVAILIALCDKNSVARARQFR
jgi:hypothetical protein